MRGAEGSVDFSKNVDNLRAVSLRIFEKAQVKKRRPPPKGGEGNKNGHMRYPQKAKYPLKPKAK